MYSTTSTWRLIASTTSIDAMLRGHATAEVANGGCRTELNREPDVTSGVDREVRARDHLPVYDDLRGGGPGARFADGESRSLVLRKGNRLRLFGRGISGLHANHDRRRGHGPTSVLDGDSYVR